MKNKLYNKNIKPRVMNYEYVVGGDNSRINNQLLEDFQKQCTYCGCIVLPENDSQSTFSKSIEHYFPKSKGKSKNWVHNYSHNLGLCCRLCNTRKDNKFSEIHEELRPDKYTDHISRKNYKIVKTDNYKLGEFYDVVFSNRNTGVNYLWSYASKTKMPKDILEIFEKLLIIKKIKKRINKLT